MTIGNCFIITSAFHKQDIGIIFIGETKSEYIFTPIIFKAHKFNNSLTDIFNGKIQTNTILNGRLGKVTGLLVIHESKKKPSFLKNYCKENKPFTTLNINSDKILLDKAQTDIQQISIGGGTSFPSTKELFDKFHIHSLTNYLNHYTLSDLEIILKPQIEQ
jgi:hypothetical protein